jgi:chorismate synthase
MLSKLRFLTSGESHGQALICVIEGIPSNLPLSADFINKDLSRRQQGFGRGGRMKIESDRVQILSGVRLGKTLGSPISLLIENKDWANWYEVMSPELKVESQELKNVTRPRPGHADLSGALKYDHKDIRNVLERSSARETATRVAAGAIAKRLLSEFGIEIISYVCEIGGAGIKNSPRTTNIKTFMSMFKRAETSPVRCPDKKTEERMIRKIKKAMKKGDSLGGVFEVVVFGVPAGLGSYSQWDRRLNAKLAFALMGIQAIKGVEIGLGFEMSRKYGSEVMDEIFYRTRTRNRQLETAGGFYRKTNNAGGIEGGMSNGMPIIVRAAMKPIPTLKCPLSSVDINTKERFKAAYERSDVCAVPAASVIGEAVTALVIADSFLEKFGGDSIGEIKRNYKGYLKQIREF